MASQQKYNKTVQYQPRPLTFAQKLDKQISQFDRKKHQHIYQQIKDNQSGSKNSIQTQSIGYFQNFFNYSSDKFKSLSKTIIFDYDYLSHNSFPFGKKQKVLKYLQAKYLTETQLLQNKEKQSIRFSEYNVQYFDQKVDFGNLQDTKNKIIKGKTIIEAAQDDLKRTQISKTNLQNKFLNQAAYQFDKQRNNSMCWGFFTGAFICSTFYRRGSTPRKAALFLAMGHLFGQISYHYNIDQYFDLVYNIFQAEAMKYALAEIQKENKEVISGKTYYMQD